MTLPRSFPIVLACTFVLPMMLEARSQYVRLDYPADDTTQYPNSFARMAVAPNGDVIRVFQLNDASNDYTIRVYRTADDGSLVWAKRIEPLSDLLQSLQDAVALPDGSIMMGGWMYGNTSFLLRMSADGDLLMARSFELNEDASLTSMLVINDTTVRLSGYEANDDFWWWSATTDPLGNIANAYTLMLGPVGSNWPSVYMHELLNGSTLYISRARYTDPLQQSGVAICLVDSAEHVEWCHTFRPTGPIAYALDPLGSVMFPDGSIRIACGFRSDWDSYADPAVLALSSTGAPLWADRIEFQSNSRIAPYGATLVSDTTFAIIGSQWLPAWAAGAVFGISGTYLHLLTWPDLSLRLHEGVRLDDGDIVATGFGSTTGIPGQSCGLIRCDPDLELCGTVDLYADVIPMNLIMEDSATQMPLTSISEDILSEFVVGDQPLIQMDPCLTTDLAGQLSEDDLNTWPNPAHDEVTIAGSAIDRIEILNTLGQVMLARSFSGVATTTIEIGAWANGLYHVRVSAKGSWHVERLIKE
jgi:hypothetical protein